VLRYWVSSLWSSLLGGAEFEDDSSLSNRLLPDFLTGG
jgi:hypothetical protein